MDQTKTNFSIKEFPADTIQNWLEQGDVLLVDVREPREYEAEHIAGAMLLPLSSLDPDYFPVLPGRKVVLHCAVGKRSEAAAKMLIVAGHTDIAHMTGGLSAWKDMGLETEVPFPEPEKAETPAAITHPGVVLVEDYLRVQNLTAKDLADKINVPVDQIDSLIAAEGSVDSELSLRLAQEFSTDPGFWMHLQVDYDFARIATLGQLDGRRKNLKSA